MNLTIGYSPCPNDTFIFDALVNNKIDTGDLSFEPILEDVETLNQWAIKGKLDITKLSFPALFQNEDKYAMMDAGAALGKGVGPLLVSNRKEKFSEEEVNQATIAVPGLHTTANFLLSFAYPNSKKRQPMLFSEIEDIVLSELADLGVIIHENRFTYKEKGLFKQLDLGEYWENKMNSPIPLGCIAAKKSLSIGVAAKVDKLIRESILFARKNYPAITDYVRQHSQTMSEDVMRKHIDLYVNDFSISLGEEGKKAIDTLRNVFLQTQE